MSNFQIVVSAAIVVGIVLAFVVWLKERRAAKNQLASGGAWVDDKDFDETVGDESPAPAMHRKALNDLDDDSFDARALGASGKPLVIKFFTTWCSGCITQGPLMEQAAARFAERADFYQVDCDVSDKLPGKGKITKIPTTFFINPSTGTQLVHVGLLTVDQVGEMLEELAAESARGSKVQADSEHPYLLA